MGRILSPKETKRRQFILTGNLWKVVMLISAPLAIYGLFNYLYGFFDLVIVSYIGGNEVASVVFIDEIKQAIIAFGAGIATAGTVIVARHYGAGNIEEARTNANTAFVLAGLISGVLVVITLLFGEPILRLLNAPEEIIQAGLGYFNIQMITTSLIALNSVFIGLEKAKGNTFFILILNIIAMVIKLILSLIFVFVLGGGTAYVALATLIAQALLLVVAIFIMVRPTNSFQLSFKQVRIKKEYIIPIVMLALPVFTGKFLFSMGKVLVNSTAAFYGTAAVAAFGIAMKLGGAPGSLAIVFEESEASIVSQNLGNSQLKRAMKTYVIAHLYAFIIGLIGLLIVSNSISSLLPLFTKNQDPMFRQMIVDIYKWEKYSVLTSSSIAVITGLFIGFRFTKIAFYINLIRLFVFRLPVLLILRYLEVDYIALGYTMFISNFMTMVVAFILLAIFFQRIRLNGYLDLLWDDSLTKT
jgi:putative MATE family efflux protein